MKQKVMIGCLVALGSGLLVSEALCGSRTDDPLGVAVSPQTMILSMDQGGAVTVHTAIPYSSVNCDSLALNGIPVSWTHVDSRGNVVAEFDEAAVKAILLPPSAMLTLTGNLKTGESFAGADMVRVVF